jgi:hypothetical protein
MSYMIGIQPCASSSLGPVISSRLKSSACLHKSSQPAWVIALINVCTVVESQTKQTGSLLQCRYNGHSAVLR